MSTKEETLFFCNLDKVSYPNKEQAKRETGTLVNRLKTNGQRDLITAKNLAEEIQKGVSFTTAELSGAKEEHFLSQQLAVVDIDNEVDIKKAEKLSVEYRSRKKEAKTLGEAYKILEAHDIEQTPLLTVENAITILTAHHIDYSFIYYSFSHSTTLPKFRIVCVLDEPITDPAEAKRLNQYFISLFPQADKSCYNLDRFYYGTDKGLATEVYDRTSRITIPKNWQSKSEPEKPTAPPISATVKEFKSKNTVKVEDEFDLTRAIQEFNLLSYVEQTTGTESIECNNNEHLFNPCPLCGHQDDFYINTEKNFYKCFGSSNGTGGNIINYIEETQKLDRKAAREYFIYELMKQEKQSKTQDFNNKIRKSKIKKHTQNELFIKINPFETQQTQHHYRMNDIGMGNLFADSYKNMSLYVPESKSWYVYNGKTWGIDLAGVIVAQQAKDLMEYLLDYRRFIEDDEKKDAWNKFILSRMTKKARDIMISDAQSVYPVSILKFDKNPYLFNMQNGTLNLQSLEV